MRIIEILLLFAFFTFALQARAADRWFNQEIVDYGNGLFQQNCARCHGPDAEGTAEWKKPGADGNYPPPPLNGSAHAWHHSLPQLAKSIKQGGIRLGGVMPPFAERLSDPQVLAVIAYFQSKWTDELYQAWHQRFMQ